MTDSLYTPADWESAVALRGALASDVAAALAAERAKGYAEASRDSRAVCSRAGGCLP